MVKNFLPVLLLVCTTLIFPVVHGAALQPAEDSGKVHCIEFSKPSENTTKARRSLALSWQKRGYLLAYADSVSPLKACVHSGHKTDSVALLYPKGSAWDTVYTTPNGTLGLMEQELVYQENNGYPFAKVSLSPIAEDMGTLWARMDLNPGERYMLDSILMPNASFSTGVFKRAAGVQTRTYYNHAKMRLLTSRLAALDGFAMVSPDVYVYIYNGRLFANVPVKRTVRDQLNGLVGLATNPDGKTLLTGEVTGRFYNMFKSGVSAAFEWRSFKARSQEMKLQLALPYLFGTPFITNVQIGFEKYDTLYTIFSRGLQLRFPLSARSSFVAGFNFVNRTRIYADEAMVRNLHQLPDNPSSRNELFQLGADYNTIIQGKIPRRGVHLRLLGSAGYRSYIRDARLAAITWTASTGNTENVFDSLQRTGHFRTPQFRLEYDLATFLPMARLWVWKIAASGFEYHAPVIYFNELTRFGGIKNVRGFNEQSIFASQMHTMAVELHLVTGESGYVGPFYNIAWYANHSTGSSSTKGSFLQGVGIVSGIQTKAGVLQIVWAVGQSGQQPFALNNSKFHFGISNTF